MSNRQDEILYRKPLPAISKVNEESLNIKLDRSDDGTTPAPPTSREHKRKSLPPLLSYTDTPYADEEIWQWLVANSDITSSSAVGDPRSRTRTKDKKHHSGTLPDELPPRGNAPFPNRAPRRNRNRNFTELFDPSAPTAKKNPFTLHDFLVKLESNGNIAKPVLEKAVLSKNHYNKILTILANRIEEDAKQNDKNRGLAVFDLNEEFDVQTFKRELKSPRYGLESILSSALLDHIREVHKEQKEYADLKKSQLAELDLPPSLAKMKSEQYQRIAKRKRQQLGKELPLSVQGETMFTMNQHRQFISEEPSDSLQFYADPTHFQDSVRTREPFALVNREDEVSPTEFAVLESLFSGGRWLSLKAHFISDIPNLMLLRKTLTYINLSFNSFIEIPIEMYEMENLQILKMRNNPIKEIPHEIVRLKKLRVLVLSFCMISSVAASFWYGMEHLILLDLSFNQLQSFPSEVMYLKSLRELNIAGNQLIGLPSGALYLNLKLINISNNYMHPLLWRENVKGSPQRLQDMAAHRLVKDKLVDRYPDLPDTVKQYLNEGFEPCDACKGPRFGSGLLVIRPCEFIFGIRNLPFVFNCCSAECVYIFRRGIADPLELRDDDEEDENAEQQQSEPIFHNEGSDLIIDASLSPVRGNEIDSDDYSL